MTETGMPKIDTGGEGGGATGGGGAGGMHWIKLVRAITSVEHHPCTGVLHRKTDIVKFFKVFLSHVIKSTITLARLAILASTFVFPLVRLLQFPLFRLNYFIVMFGHLPLRVTRAIYTTW